jgi:hypothetical protein
VSAGLALLLSAAPGSADPLEYIGKPVRGISVSSAVKVGKSVFYLRNACVQQQWETGGRRFFGADNADDGEFDLHSKGIRH